MVAPYNRIGEIHELGITPAVNIWSVSQHEDTEYVQTYPEKSVSFFHNASYAKGKIAGIGGMELPTFLATWLEDESQGLILAFRPYAGFQYANDNITFRLNVAPVFLYVTIGGDWDYGFLINPSLSTFYQASLLLHNQQPSKHTYWIGIRNSPAALGGTAGYEHRFTEKHIARLECSVLGKPPFSLLLSGQELESIKGYVAYITTGFFLRLK